MNQNSYTVCFNERLGSINHFEAYEQNNKMNDFSLTLIQTYSNGSL